MARKRELAHPVIEVKLEEQLPSEPSDGEEEISQDDEEEDDDEDEDEDESEEDEEENNEVEDEEEEDFSSKESIRNLLEPFSKEQLMEIITDAVVKNPSLLSRIDDAETETDPVHRKIFVYDLESDATSETLSAVFSPFGQIENCRVIMKKHTGRSKCYGFVLFRTRAAAKRALKDPLKIIGDRAAKCRLASSGRPAAAGQVLGPTFRIGLLNPAAGLSPSLSGGVPGVRPVGSASKGSVVSVNSISPSVIGNYGSLAAVHGLGAYQNSAPSAATRPPTGVGSWGASGLEPFYGR